MPAKTREDKKLQREGENTWPFLDKTHLESPALLTISLLPRITATQAVLPQFGPVKSEWGP